MKRKCIFITMMPLYLIFLSLLLTGTAAADSHSGFIGAETCQECHEEQYASYAKSIHSRKAIKGPASQDACEACHGPGAMHVEKGGGRDVDIFSFDSDASASDKSSKCLECHQKTHDFDVWDMGKHARNEVSCDDCHDMHNNASQKPSQPEVCFDCHRGVRFDVSKRSHHPILEGKVSCSSCHSPHGSISRSMVKTDDPQELCYSCHADKRGPYIYEHPPVEENCMACHLPHGSRHAKLMAQKVPNICQDCHHWSRHPATPYDGESGFTGSGSSNRFFGRSCLNCHGAIHGGNTFENHALTR